MKLRKTAPSIGDEKENLGENVFDTLKKTSAHVDYVILDKDYVKNIDSRLNDVLIGGKRNTTEEKITMNFDAFTNERYVDVYLA